jgi:Ca2+-binding EF-hand superfamily protein
MRIFDSDGNDYLDFKEFLLAMDIATCDTEESKLKWAFKLFDPDNSGYLEVSAIDIKQPLRG